ncbi:MAG: hypothetical protein JNK27_05760 [Chitinophagaceae bacterium]|nr:hypothetical protein [Chitinophagaceae bacterium]
MKLIKIFSICILAAVIFANCTKPENGIPTKAKKEFLTQASWKYVKYETKTVSSAWIDEFPGWSACSKDDLIIFKTDGAYEHNAGPIACSPGSQIIETGAWAFTDNEAKFKITTTGTREWTIEQLSDTILIISIIDNTPGFISERSTFKH